MKEKEELSVFKSYLRALLQDLKDIKAANDAGDRELVNKLVTRLIDNTQAGIED